MHVVLQQPFLVAQECSHPVLVRLGEAAANGDKLCTQVYLAGLT